MGIIRIMLKKHKLAENMIINIIASGLPIIAMHFLILPLVSRKVGDEQYGLILSLISLMNLIPATLGSTLSSIRLLHNDEYKNIKENGDFPIFILVGIFLNFIFVLLFSIYYLKKGFVIEFQYVHIILLLVLSLFFLVHNYFCVEFLINLNYAAILYSNLFLILGYFFGCIFFLIYGYWEHIYIAGYFLSLIYILFHTSIWKEPFKITRLFRKMLNEELIYLGACFIYRLMTYADKLLLFPLLGGIKVSVYYVATLFGKFVSLLITPINSVMISYLSKHKENKISLKVTLSVSLPICFLGYLISLVLARPILSILYPQYVDEASKLICITSATMMINVIISLVNPYILCYKTMKWQVLINLATLFVYLIFSLVFLNLGGVKGFCYGVLISSIFKLLISFIIYCCTKN